MPAVTEVVEEWSVVPLVFGLVRAAIDVTESILSITSGLPRVDRRSVLVRLFYARKRDRIFILMLN